MTPDEKNPMMQAWKENFALQVALQKALTESELPRLQSLYCRKLFLEMKAQGFGDDESLQLTIALLHAGQGAGSGGGA